MVACADIDRQKVEMLRSGDVYEPGLEELVRRNTKEGRLRFTTSVAEAMTEVAVAFIAVGTPLGKKGEAYLSQVLAVAEEIGRHIRGDTVVVVKRTVPVGTTDQIAATIGRVAPGPFEVVANPEFLKEGSAIDDFMGPDRIVIGVRSEPARKVMAGLHAPLVRTEQPILFMVPRSAELTRFATNAMLATRVSVMNDVAALCEQVGGDVDQVRRGMGSTVASGTRSCFRELDFDLLRSVGRINERQKRELVEKALQHFGSLQGLVFGVWGLAFKPRTDDMREAPSINIIEGFIGNGARVKAHDPVAAEVAARIFKGRVELTSDPYAAAEGVDALFLVTEWNEFRQPDFQRLKRIMRQPVLFDGRNVWDGEEVPALGFVYHGIGRASA